LMRTKLEPYAEDWIEQGRRLGREGSGDAPADHTIDPWKQNARTSTTLSGEDLKALWQWAPIEANRLARQRKWGGNYTLEEKAMGIENVVTGLRNRGDDEDESEDESDSEDEEEEEGDPMLPMEEIFKFMMTGAPPKSRVTPASRV
ncbi:mediator of RNA polymerase II transcription subunit 8, partial [Ascosphaera aggregata]